MSDLNKALADIEAIKQQVARGTQFRGYGPVAVALTGVVALLAAGLQALWVDRPRDQVAVYLTIWIVAAIASASLIHVPVTLDTNGTVGRWNEIVRQKRSNSGSKGSSMDEWAATRM